MLRKLAVRNFQSIRSADIELGKLTVIVGASNSGKSALLRAARVLANNANSPSFVKAGEAKSTILLALEDGTAVALDRGPSLSTYRIRVQDSTQEYPKSGVTVPADVSRILRLPVVEGEEICFAFQFDRPFLLDATGSKVAKILGDLSNANVIYEAVREANRRRLDANGTLKVRLKDLEELKEKAGTFRDLPARMKAMEEAEALLEEAADVQTRLAALEGALSAVEAAEAALTHLEGSLPRVPDEDFMRGLLDLADRRDELWKAIYAADIASGQMEKMGEEIRSLEDREASLHEAYHGKLVEAGTCPTCGQATKELEPA